METFLEIVATDQRSNEDRTRVDPPRDFEMHRGETRLPLMSGAIILMSRDGQHKY